MTQWKKFIKTDWHHLVSPESSRHHDEATSPNSEAPSKLFMVSFCLLFCLCGPQIPFSSTLIYQLQWAAVFSINPLLWSAQHQMADSQIQLLKTQIFFLGVGGDQTRAKRRRMKVGLLHFHSEKVIKLDNILVVSVFEVIVEFCFYNFLMCITVDGSRFSNLKTHSFSYIIENWMFWGPNLH